MGNRKAPSPPPGSPGYKGPMQFKPAPPPPPPAKRGTVTVKIENADFLYSELAKFEGRIEAAVNKAARKVLDDMFLGRPKGKKR